MEYEFGFCLESMLPYRKRGDGTLEFATIMNACENAAPTDTIVGIYNDGSEHVVHEMTHDAFAKFGSGKVGGKRSNEVLWTWERLPFHHALVLQQRVDRALLLSLCEQPAQVLQLKPDVFGPLLQPQPSLVRNPFEHETIVKALEFLKPLCVDYASGAITDKESLKRKRDEGLERLGLSSKPKSSRVLKRPAATKEVEDPLVKPQTQAKAAKAPNAPKNKTEGINVLKKPASVLVTEKKACLCARSCFEDMAWEIGDSMSVWNPTIPFEVTTSEVTSNRMVQIV